MFFTDQEFSEYSKYANVKYGYKAVKYYSVRHPETHLKSLIEGVRYKYNSNYITRPMLKSVINDYYLNGGPSNNPREVGVIAARLANQNNMAIRNAIKKASIGDMARNIVKYANQVKDNPRNAENIESAYRRISTFMALFAIFSSWTIVPSLIALFAAFLVNRKAVEVKSVKEYQNFKELYRVIMANKNIPKSVKESEMMQAWDDVLSIIESLSSKDARLSKQDVNVLKDKISYIQNELEDMKYIHRDLRKASAMLSDLHKNYTMKR